MNDNKICKVCLVSKPLEDYPFINSKRVLKSGEVKMYRVRRHSCRQCVSAQSRKQMILKNRNKQLYAA